MTEEPVPTVTTQHPSNEPMVITAPLNTPMSIAQLIADSASVADLQAQITALAARVTALEQAGVAEESHQHESTRRGKTHHAP